MWKILAIADLFVYIHHGSMKFNRIYSHNNNLPQHMFTPFYLIYSILTHRKGLICKFWHTFCKLISKFAT